MHQPYLEVTFRNGRLLAAYYYLPRRSDDEASRACRHEPGLIVDYAESDRPIGVEITSPCELTLERFNEVLTGIGQAPVGESDFAPLRAA